MLVSKLIKIITLFLLIANCSLNNKSNIWSSEKKTKIINDKIENIFKKKKNKIQEFNKDIRISLKKNLTDETQLINENYLGISGYSGKLKKISKYNFSKIKRFDEMNPELIFHKENIIFFDNKGSLLKFKKKSKPIWKKNYYSKTEKKLKPTLFMAVNNDTLIVADTVSKLYAVSIESGKLIWSKYNESPFNSQVKIYNDQIFVLDSQNQLHCYSIKDGKKNWSIKTEESFINSDGKLSIVIKNDKLFFNNSFGDITAIDINSGTLIWQISTQNSLLFEDVLNLKTSKLVVSKNSILFSNNKNEFYSLDQETGKINWKQMINSNLTPVVGGSLIMTISLDGYLYYIDHETGNIVKIINIFKQLNKKIRKSIKPIGFAMTYSNLYMTTNNGRLITLENANGTIKSITKIDNNKISRPFIFDKSIFIIKDRSIIKYR